MEEEQKEQAPDPMAIAVELAMGVLTTLADTSTDPEKRAATTNIIGLVQALALVDIANTLREIKDDKL